ncbi:d39c029e-460b-4271-a5a4-25a933d010b4 [Sclerotinia trifoliorum]|uniref:D39c029e-460b-4271-a5a4-25a933d010b4 n=1 Tax=Sclerotinia trifoliorum TaxID=28548 RepID=A0A8H2W4T5_9HELO|nr:d39c029e-460b-4271-a5a4-25a933d010b4 [Sclerotinia trifoliorum]
MEAIEHPSDMVSKPWDTTTLAIGGAMLATRVQPPDLTGPVHPFFARDRWEVADEDYQLLLPSMRLATRLLEIGTPYLASFLPTSKIFGTPQDVSHSEHRKIVAPKVIQTKKQILVKDLQVAELELEAISRCIKWRLNERMHADKGWNGITRIVDHGEADFHELDENEIAESDLQAGQAGQVRRPLVIAIMDLLLVPMRTHPRDSEIRLKAQFMAAITMTHEIGHAVFLQDYRSFNPPTGDEPYVDRNVDSELGRSFISWIFKGYHPQFCESHEKDAQFGSLGWSLYWQPLYRITQLFGNDKEHRRPLYEKLYAIPVGYLSNMFRQGWWEANRRGVPAHKLAGVLRGSLNLAYRDELGAATAVKANWWMDPLARRPRWRGHYRVGKYSTGEPVEGLTKDQIAAQMRLDRQKFSFGLNDDDDDLDDEMEQLAREHTPGATQNKSFSGRDNRTMIAYSVETHDDGMLDEDIGYIEDDDSEVVTQIEVRYRPTTEFQPRSTELIAPNKLVEQARKDVLDELTAEEKAAASGMLTGSGPRPGKRENLNDYLSIHGPSKRLRTVVEADKTREDATLLEKVVRALDQSSANEVGHWTRIQAWYYCLEHGLAVAELPKTAAAQQAKLDNGTETNYKIMRKIQYHLLQKLWDETYDDGGNPESVLIARYILHLVDFFLDEDIDVLAEKMHIYDLDTPRKRERSKELLKSHLQQMIDGEHLKAPQGNVTLKEQLQPLHALAPEPAQWSEDDLRSWCRQKGIPQWGSISGLITRVNRFREEEENVKVGIAGRTKPPSGRTNRTGTEIYRFSAVLRHSSLDALKSSLFIHGNFPSDTELDLWVNTNEILKPGPLDKQSPKIDWKRLVLRAMRTATPRQPVKISREERIRKINRHNDLINDQLQARKEGPEGFSTRMGFPSGETVLNKVSDISQRALALTRIRNAPGTRPGQSWKKHDRANLIKGKHLIDMIMDLEDLEAKTDQDRIRRRGKNDKRAEEDQAASEQLEKEFRRVTHMKLIEKRFTTDYGSVERLGIGEEEVKEVVKEVEDEEDEWQEDYV